MRAREILSGAELRPSPISELPVIRYVNAINEHDRRGFQALTMSHVAQNDWFEAIEMIIAEPSSFNSRLVIGWFKLTVVS